MRKSSKTLIDFIRGHEGRAFTPKQIEWITGKKGRSSTEVSMARRRGCLIEKVLLYPKGFAYVVRYVPLVPELKPIPVAESRERALRLVG